MDFKYQVLALVLALGLDLALADPYSWPHPVKAMGRLIDIYTKKSGVFDKDKKAQLTHSIRLTSNMVTLAILVPWVILTIGKKINFYLYFALYTYLIYTCISLRGMAKEAKKVLRETDKGLDEGRRQVAMIVGRSTDSLSQEEIYKATIESTAESTADGVIAPLFYILLLGSWGPIGGMVYKVVNTMDSMVAYRTAKFINYGRYPAILDDILNFIPARITGFFLLLAGFLLGLDVKKGIRILKRDRKAHLSPNSAYPEAVVAGLLGISLGGGHYYKGVFIDKPTIGDETKKTSRKDVDLTIRLLYLSSFLFLGLGLGISLLIRKLVIGF